MNAIRWRILEIILEATYRGIPWRSGGKDSPLVLQGAWGQSLVGPRTQIPQAAQCGVQKKKKKRQLPTILDLCENEAATWGKTEPRGGEGESFLVTILEYPQSSCFW